MVAAVERVRDRLLRSTRTLATAGVPYAVAGGNAVAAWVSRVDTAAVRNTQDVDILIRREDLDRARAALESAGFVYHHVAGVDVFLDGPDAKPRDGVHVVFAGEKVRAHEPAANPDVSESEDDALFRVLSLEALVRIKLTAFRDKDRTHIRDMLEVGLIDSTWLVKLPPELARRLQLILDDPNG
ncbi:MAG TPA: nucleotidyltransferase family protein [Tepidisphaeraceae bacterium]|nr:nucleotidyltransferase family protein [Tepidisphaeraceae bacterium]